jgi:ankyrin repeat protein
MPGVSYGSIIKSSQPYPVFFWLVRDFNAQIGEYLLSKGAEVDQKDEDGNTALLAAVTLRADAPAKFLIEHGADPMKLCNGEKFPLKVLQDDDNWYDESKKIGLVKAMMKNMKDRRAAQPAPEKHANDDVIATKHDISVKPFELKKRPPGKFEL